MSDLNSTHKLQLYSDLVHACVVLMVVFCVTILASVQVGLPPDVIGTVYGGAIGYAAGRAGNVAARTSFDRSGDALPTVIHD